MTPGPTTQPPPRLPEERGRTARVLRELDQLPTLSPVAVRVLSIAASPRSSARDVVAAVRGDASLAAAILRAVRRADLGLRIAGPSLEQAVVQLGFATVRNIVLAVKVFGVFSDPQGEARSAESRRRLWQHNIAVALLADQLSQTKIEPGDGQAFVAGLLHDVGKIALDACFPKSYARAVEVIRRRRICASDAELEVFGLEHAAVGKRLLQQWRLPPEVVECTWLHHQPPESLPNTARSTTLIHLIQLADRLAYQMGWGAAEGHPPADTDTLRQRLHIDAATLADVVSRLPQQVEALSGSIGLVSPDHPDQLRVSLWHANRELARLNAELLVEQDEWRRQKETVVALSRFASLLPPRPAVEDICRAMAACFRCWLRAGPTVAVFARSNGSNRPELSIGFCSGVEADCELRTCADEPLLPDCDPQATGSEFTRVPPPYGWDHLWEICFRLPIETALWQSVRRCGHDGRLIIVADAPADIAESWNRRVAEHDPLMQWMVATLEATVSRDEAERTTQDLLDMNRRLHSTRDDMLIERSRAMIAAMAGGAAHEMNNPLAVISGRAQLLRGETDEPTLRRGLDHIIEQANRASSLALELMAFAKPESPRTIDIHVASALDTQFQRWQDELGCDAGQLRIELTDPSIRLFADPGQWSDIMIALVRNAMEATSPEHRRIVINSHSRTSDEKVRIAVRDNGVGMSKDVLDRAFDPFFSHRRAGRGRGLGLSRAFRLAEINSGRLWLESTPNIGTTATVELPQPPSE